MRSLGYLGREARELALSQPGARTNSFEDNRQVSSSSVLEK